MKSFFRGWWKLLSFGYTTNFMEVGEAMALQQREGEICEGGKLIFSHKVGINGVISPLYKWPYTCVTGVITPISKWSFYPTYNFNW